MTPSPSLPPFSRGVPKMLEALRPGNRNPRDHYVVCGANALTYRLVEELSQRYAAAVTVIMTAQQRRTGRDFSDLPGVRVLAAERLDDKVFLAAGLPHAAGLALTEQDDVGNIHAAMRAEELNHRIRIVVRVFNLSLGMRVRQLFRDCAVISDSAIAAPAFVQAALGDNAPTYFRFAGRTLYATHRSEVAARDVICGLSRTAADGTPEVLPLDHETADVVLAVARGEKAASGHSQNGEQNGEQAGEQAVGGRVRKRRRRSWTVGALLRFLRGGVSRGLRIGLAITSGLLVAGGVSLTLANHESAWAGVYETLLTAFSGADASRSTWVQVSQLIVTVSGMALVPLITAVVVEGLVNAKLAFTSGRVLDHYEDHVVVVGLGNVGTRVIRSLRDLGVPVIAIDKSEAARGVAIARELEIPLVIGDAAREETLRTASVQACRALVIVSTEDVVNLEAALNGRALRPGLKVVLRMFEEDLAERIQRTFSIATSRSVSSIAAPAFAAALMEREVLATIPIGRRVLLVADLVVAPGSVLDGARVTAATIDGQARVIAVGVRGEPRPQWTPPESHVLAAHDRVTVIVTRGGLSRLLRLAGPAPDATAPVPAEPPR